MNKIKGRKEAILAEVSVTIGHRFKIRGKGLRGFEEDVFLMQRFGWNFHHSARVSGGGKDSRNILRTI